MTIKFQDSVVIGSGYWGSNIIRELYKKKRLYGIIETNKKLSKKHQDEFGVKILNFKDLNNKIIKNCFVTTPSYLHYEHCKKILKFKKNIFVEKPLSFNLQEIKNLSNIVKKNKLNFMVGYLLLHHPALIKLKSILKKQKKILSIQSSRKSNGKIRPKDNVLWNLAIHDIAFLIDIFKKKLSIKKCINIRFKDKRIDLSQIYIKLKKQINYSGSFSWSHHQKHQNFSIKTSDKLFIFDDLKAEKLVQYDCGLIKDKLGNGKMRLSNMKIINYEKISPLENELNFFLDKVDNKKKYNNLDFTFYLSKILNSLCKY